jgi:ribonuclease PH
MLEESVPPFLKGSGKGWLSAEYGMLPGCSSERITRERSRGKMSGRTHEIQRLIGRSLRAVLDFEALGERMFWVDCDVLQADGGTRTASITGSFVALADAVSVLRQRGLLGRNPIQDCVAGMSVGIVDGQPMLDLCYEEDRRAEVDMNVVMTGSGKLVEIQGTAEHRPFTEEDLRRMMSLARKGIREIVEIQKRVVKL